MQSTAGLIMSLNESPAQPTCKNQRPIALTYSRPQSCKVYHAYHYHYLTFYRNILNITEREIMS